MTGGTFGYIRVFWEQQTIHIAFWTLVSRDLTLTSSLQSFFPCSSPHSMDYPILIQRLSMPFLLIPGLLLRNPMDHLIDSFSIRRSSSDLQRMIFCYTAGGYLFICVPRNLFFVQWRFSMFLPAAHPRERKKERERYSQSAGTRLPSNAVIER